MHHILGNKVLEYYVDDRGVIIDEREYDAANYNKIDDNEQESVNLGTKAVLPDSGTSVPTLLL